MTRVARSIDQHTRLCYRALVTNLPLPASLAQLPATIFPPTPHLDASQVSAENLAQYAHKGWGLLGLGHLNTLARLQPYLRSLVTPSVTHWLWTGPANASGTPILWRYRGRKNVPVHRILWNIYRPDALTGEHGRLRRLRTCRFDPLCVAPICFELAATPMEAESLPDYFSQPPRLARQLASGDADRRWHKVSVLEGLQDRYIYRGDDEVVACASCGELNRRIVCPVGHIQTGDWTRDEDSRVAMLGRQYRCGTCTKIRNAVLEIRGSRPRAGFRPPSPSHNNREQEMRMMEAHFREFPGSDEIVGPGADAEREREMQAMEEQLRTLPTEPDE